ncbi:MAG: methyltransferase domain-containing protein [Nitrospinae bacterium]|nr:methyltransferase domain-containing protein [Nitrospinota bacterium]
MQIETIKRIYANYSHFYDLLFKQFFYPRQKYVIQSMQIKPNEKVLDVGVGTGLSLSIYPRHCYITGIDVSKEMLNKARKKVEKFSLSHVTLREMDAMNLDFEDNAFDYVFATFVISVVPDPIRVISEMKRVAKNDGKIVIVNHFQSQNKFIAKIEKWICPLSRRIGWRSDLSLDYLVRETNIEIDYSYKLKKIDLWNVVFVTNNKSD